MIKKDKEIAKAVHGVLDILHDVPTEKVCRYFSEQECLYPGEDEHGKNWCNNCVCWHIKVGTDTGVETIYHRYPKATGLHASMLRSLYEEAEAC